MTIFPNIWMNRRYESKAKRSLPACRASPRTEWSLRPRLRTVSIIPGIEYLAPDRTETSRGLSRSPRRRPMACSRPRRWPSTSSRRPSGKPPELRYSLHASVVMVNPGGTGRPRFVISARLAPLPPRRSFMSLLPSRKS
jgi:hypothetical protein